MKKASIHVLLIEELTDLLYELNDIYNLHREVNCKHGLHLHHRLMKTIFYTAFTAELASRSTDNPREMNDMMRSTFSTIEQDGYVDRSDLEYAIEKALTHITRMNLAYSPELDQGIATLLEIIKLCLTDTNYYIYGDREINTPTGDDMRLAEESPSIQEQ